MLFWNIGFDGMRSVFYIDNTDLKLQLDHHPLCIPNIPFKLLTNTQYPLTNNLQLLQPHAAA